MNERELLEIAAKACGLNGHQWCEAWECMALYLGEIDGFDRSTCWNPKRGDGDCARMEAALDIDVEWHNVGVRCAKLTGTWCDDVVARESFHDHNCDKQAARRMASLRVAAEIGRAKVST